jgi:hypothetical protein
VSSDVLVNLRGFRRRVFSLVLVSTKLRGFGGLSCAHRNFVVSAGFRQPRDFVTSGLRLPPEFRRLRQFACFRLAEIDRLPTDRPPTSPASSPCCSSTFPYPLVQDPCGPARFYAHAHEDTTTSKYASNTRHIHVKIRVKYEVNTR